MRGLLWSSIYDDNPVIFFEHRLLYPIKEEVPEKLEPIPLGKARVVREGTDVTVIATGPLVHRSLEAAERGGGGGHLRRGRRPAHAAAAGRGDARRVGEEDEPRGRRARGRDADGLRRRGRGRVQEQAFDWLDAPIERVGAKFAPLAFAPAMEQFVIPQAADVLAAMKRTVGK